MCRCGLSCTAHLVYLLIGITFSIFGVCSVSRATDQPADLHEETPESYRFGMHLFKMGEYYRAITEFERYCFLFPNGPLIEKARFYIGEAFFLGKQYGDATTAFERFCSQFPKSSLLGKSLLLKGRCYIAMESYEKAYKSFREVLDSNAGSSDKRDAILESYALDLLLSDKKPSLPNIDKLAEQGIFSREDVVAIKDYQAATSHKTYKSPAVAGVLSAIIPGSGLLYCKRYGDFPIALVLNGLTIWLSTELYLDKLYVYAGFATALELGWYGGGIYHSVNSTYKYNKKIKKDLIEQFHFYLRPPIEGDERWQTGFIYLF